MNGIDKAKDGAHLGFQARKALLLHNPVAEITRVGSEVGWQALLLQLVQWPLPLMFVQWAGKHREPIASREDKKKGQWETG